MPSVETEPNSFPEGQKNLREALAAAELRFHTIFENSPIPVQLFAPDGHCTFGNKSLWRLFNYTAEEIAGYNILKDDYAVKLGLMPYIERAFRGETVSLPAFRYNPYMVGKTGPSRWLELYMYPILDGDGKIKEVVSLIQDITAAKRAEESRCLLDDIAVLLSSSKEFKPSLKAMAELTIQSFADWCIVDMPNEKGELSPVVLAHKDSKKIENYLQSREKFPVRKNKPHGIAKVYRTGESDLFPYVSDELIQMLAINDEHLQIFKDVNLRSVIIVPFFRHKQPIGTVTFILSTDSHIYDETDLYLAEELARRVAIALENSSLYTELKEKEASLIAALKTRDEFMSIASHELRTPLTPMKLQLQALSSIIRKNELHKIPQEKIEKIVKSTERQAHRLAVLVEELLDVARINSGKLAFSTEPVNLNEVIRDVCERYVPEGIQPGYELTELCEDDIIGIWDRVRIEQVLINILTNAIKYAPGHPIKITIELIEGFAVITIADQGPGIAPENLKRIFERFERVVATNHIGGLGLGLYIAKEIVEAHGGTIHAESQLGQGAEFIVRLPLTPLT